ncbi:hypothetical protein F2Q69_00061725 [Brassica cretica]|uniref:Uncharacterized protein n=1 Tax=Brassica cretica TaxID=69181 RepID=A0A8S9RLK1_BRACR|nr:hypothetical protein F2Q69_00061725 [Brassica cretica]
MGIRTAYSEESQSTPHDDHPNHWNEEPEVFVATNINPKLVGGRLFPNKTSTTHFYLDNECVAGASYLQRELVDKTPGLGPSTRSTWMVAQERSHRLTNLERSEAF